ncbi:superoxide dismutase, partial [Pseudomonas aeruginosa]
MAGVSEPRLNLIEPAFVAPFLPTLFEETKMPYELKPLSCDPA